MSQNSSNASDEARVQSPKRRWWMAIVLPLWVLAGLLAAQLVVTGALWALRALHIQIDGINQNIFMTIVAVLIYIICLVFVIGIPWLIWRSRVRLSDIGLNRLPTWTDILMAPAGMIIYFVISAFLMFLATSWLPWFDVSQAQDTGFSQLGQRYEYILAFLTLVIIAPIAEEILFRGYLLGKISKYMPVWLAILITSVLFGFVHGAWNLAIDTFALSVVLCLLRISTKSLWAPILLHTMKNSLAFYILFINPALLTTLGG